MNYPLADDHTEMDALLEEFFDAVGCADVERIYKSLDFFRARLAMHIRAEHLHLFPAILNAVETQAAKNVRVPFLDEAQKAIKDLQDDHNFFMRELLAMIKLLREWREMETDADFSEQFTDLRFKMVLVKSRLETHNHQEETEVYKWLDLLLSSPERDVLDEQMQREITNLPPRFAKCANF